MKKLILKTILYAFLLVITLEILVRIFYLGKDMPHRYIDDRKVEKWKPNQKGFSVTGNRRQNFSEYRINNFGFNSYHDFKPTSSKIEIALVGDSFIEGFHQHYYNSIGTKIENKLNGIEVYEYGYAGYDFADQLHLINEYKKHFELIDHVFLGIKFSNDLLRDRYEVITDRMRFETPPYSLIKKCKLIIYLQSIGAIDSFKNFILGQREMNTYKIKKVSEEENQIKSRKYIKNFKSLVSLYGFNKKIYVLLLDSNITSKFFLDYLDENNFKYIDFGPILEKSKKPTTLIYDRHWNNHGRNLIASSIINYYKENK